jgi:hypothetical protein
MGRYSCVNLIPIKKNKFKKKQNAFRIFRDSIREYYCQACYRDVTGRCVTATVLLTEFKYLLLGGWLRDPDCMQQQGSPLILTTR